MMKATTSCLVHTRARKEVGNEYLNGPVTAATMGMRSVHETSESGPNNMHELEGNGVISSSVRI